jgi:hypothetical protein
VDLNVPISKPVLSRRVYRIFKKKVVVHFDTIHHVLLSHAKSGLLEGF